MQVTSTFSFFLKVFYTSAEFDMSSANLDWSRNFPFGKELTLSQTTNIRLFQTEEFADNNFEFDENSRNSPEG